MPNKFLRYNCTILFLLLYTSTFSQDPDFHIYLCFGQSNMAGAGTIENRDKTVNNRFQMMQPMDCPNLGKSFGEWYPAVPPLWGCNGGLGPSDYFGRTMVDSLPSDIKVGVIVVAVPGCDIALFAKTGYEGYDTYNYVPSEYGGSAYAWLLDMAKSAQNNGVIKGILLHQGETNNGQRDWPEKVKGVYNNLISDLELNASKTPLLAGELLYQDQGGVCWGHNSVIANLPDVLPNSHVISAEGLPGKDQFHFNSEGNRTFGFRYAQKMLHLLPRGTSPEVVLTSPLNNSEYTTIETVNLTANASDEDGEVIRVDFYDGTVLLGSDSTVPYSFEWAGMSEGTHSITARAIDNDGNSAISEVTAVAFQALQAPYNGSAHLIPGRVEAEEYDMGGEGVAYHELNADGNEGMSTFRNDQVDIEMSEDTSGQYNIGYILDGEWLGYSVDVTSTGTYSLHLRVASEGEGKTMHLEMDGTDISGPLEVPNTGGWQKWTTVTFDNIDLTEGQHIFRFVFDADYMNFNYFELRNLSTGAKYKSQVSDDANVSIALKHNLQIETEGHFYYRITDLSGSLIKSGKGMNIVTIDMKITPGVYILSVQNKNGKIIRRLLKSR